MSPPVRKSVLIEGAGGWLAPIATGVTIADLCAALNLPVIVVTANRLGCVNHTLLTLESIRARNIECCGIILNNISSATDDATLTNYALIEEFSPSPILLQISPGQTDICLPDALTLGLAPHQ